MKLRINKKIVSYVLIAAFLFTVLPTNFKLKAEGKADKNSKKEVTVLKELVEKRTEDQKVFLNSDGSYTLKIFKSPVNYKNGDKYDEIDNTLIKDEEASHNGSNKYKNKASNIKLSLDEDMNSEEPISVNFDKYKVSLRPLKGDLKDDFKTIKLNKKGEVLEEDNGKLYLKSNSTNQSSTGNEDLGINSVEYKDDKNSKSSIRYTPLIDGIKEEIVLDSYTGRNTFEFQLKLEGLEPNLLDNGNLALLDKTTKKIMASIPKPFMYDSSENEHYSDSIIMSIKKENEKKDLYTIKISADKSFLTNETTKYPVVVDPSITIGSSSTWADAFVQSAYPYTNYQLSTELRAGYDSTTGKVRSYVKYSGLPSLGNAYIISSTFTAYGYTNVAYGNNAPIELHRVYSDWSSGSITWNNAPSFNSSAEYTANVSSPGWYSWDITQLTRDWYKGAQGNYGFVLKDHNETYY